MNFLVWSVMKLSGARGSTTTFVERSMGDMLVAWEDEALFNAKQDAGKFEVNVPSISILAEPPISVVDKVVDEKGTRTVAEAYLQYLYTPAAQEIAAKHFYRPTDKAVFAKYGKQFAKVDLFTAVSSLSSRVFIRSKVVA
jgi:sulfate transport system substrate-binding protein